MVERMQAIRRTTLAATLLTCVSLIVLIAPPDRADGTTSLGAARRSVEPSRAASGLTPASTSLSGVSQVTSGLGHTCALLLVGQVRCWGDNSSGQLGDGTTTTSLMPVGVVGLSGATRLSAGDSHTCAVVAGGQVRCWGGNLSGQLGSGSVTSSTVPVAVAGLSGVTHLSSGVAHTCATVAGGQVRCWGGNLSGQLGNGTNAPSTSPVAVPGLTGVAQVAAGEVHTCARLTAGQVRCWGGNLTGQLGNGTLAESLVPTAVTGLAGVTSISVGIEHSCATLSTGQGRCWGRNFEAQLGTGAAGSDQLTPVGVSGLSGSIAVSSGGGHNCAVLTSGQVRCWGNNLDGQLGGGFSTSTTALIAVAGLSGVTQVEGGATHTCAVLTSGQVRCWGSNRSGALGTSSSGAPVPLPVAVIGLSGASVLTTGGAHSCAVVAAGQLRCWGENSSGQLGDPSIGSATSTLVATTGLSGATQASAGGDHTCALVAGGQARCWGENGSGQLGNGAVTDASAPVAVPGLSGATRVAAGGSHSCVLVAGGQARCWGANGAGQLGNAQVSFDPTVSPVAVNGLSGATQIVAGGSHTCALLAVAQVRCWGANFVGQVGSGISGGGLTSPVGVTGLSGVSQIAAGNDHTCALLGSGQVRCWGANFSGQLGNSGVGASTPTPVAVTGLSGVVQIAAGGSHSCAVLSNGQARCWGANGFGQLGAGFAGSPSPAPVGVTGLSGAVRITAGRASTCVTVAGGQARCWGVNESGELGNGATVFSATPLSVLAM